MSYPRPMKRVLPCDPPCGSALAMSPAGEAYGSVTGILSATAVRIEAMDVNQGRTTRFHSTAALLPPPSEVTLSGTLGVAFADRRMTASHGQLRPATGGDGGRRLFRWSRFWRRFPSTAVRLHQPAAMAVTFGACIRFEAQTFGHLRPRGSADHDQSRPRSPEMWTSPSP